MRLAVSLHSYAPGQIQPRSGSSPGPWLHNIQSIANHSSTSISTSVCKPTLRHCIRAARISQRLLRLPHRFQGNILGSLTGDKLIPGVGANSRSTLLLTTVDSGKLDGAVA